MAGETDRVGRRVVDAFQREGAGIAISAVTVWEVAIKRRLGKLEVPGDLLAELERAEVELLPITARHADQVATLPDHHRDPFDRLLVAQAMVEEMAIASGDESLRAYGVEVIW